MGWTSLSRQARGLGTAVALPGHWSPASPIVPSGDETTGGTELGGGSPSHTIAHSLHYAGTGVLRTACPRFGSGYERAGQGKGQLQDAAAAPVMLPVTCSAARHHPPSPSEPPSPSPQPSAGAAPLEPPPRAVSPHGKGKEKPPANRRDIPRMPTPAPTHLSASILLSPMGPSHALVYSRPLCPVVAYWQRRTPSLAGEFWSLLLPMASTAFTLPHFQQGSLTALPGGRQKRVEELQVEDFLGCTASAEPHLSPCLVQGIWRSPHPGFACLQVCLGDQDRQVHKVLSYGEKRTLGEQGTPCPPCPNMQGTWWSPTEATVLYPPAALVTQSNSMGSANVLAERYQPALSGSWPPDGAGSQSQAGPVPSAKGVTGQGGLEWVNPALPLTCCMALVISLDAER